MCLLCVDLIKNKIKPYDASLLAGEMRNQLGEEHYQEIIELIKKIEEENAKSDWELLEDFEMDFGGYTGLYGEDE